jgi:hypothetical protein
VSYAGSSKKTRNEFHEIFSGQESWTQSYTEGQRYAEKLEFFVGWED